MKSNHPYDDMDREAHRVAYLIAGFLRNKLTGEEEQELDEWVTASDENMQLFEDLTDEKNIEANLEWMDRVQAEHSLQQLKETDAFHKPARRKKGLLWMAAASVILLAGLFLLDRFGIKRNNGANPLVQADTTILYPGSNRATLTLSNGSVIDLASADTGAIYDGLDSHISRPADGELVYGQDIAAGTDIFIHTLSTPVGGQFQVKLQDGTKVWLNAGSLLRYPSRFTSKERKVELEGEAYFEVAKNTNQPFSVLLDDSTEVTVLGTHFNVSAYGNEKMKQVTLLEGSVKVSSKTDAAMMRPGMQASITRDIITTTDNIDTGVVTAWKNGLFSFHDASIETIMTQIERWYGAQVVIKGEIKQQFNATILRSEPLTKLLRLLELNGNVKFRIENKIIYVMP